MASPRKIIPWQQQGGTAGGQDIQQQVIALVQAAANGDQQAQQQIEQIMQAAQKGDQQAVQIAQMIQQVVEAMQQQARSARLGAKLSYIHRLRTGVNPDEEVVYEKCGGKLKKKAVKKANKGIELTVSVKKPAVKPKSKTYFECKGGKAMKKSTKKAYFEA